MAHLHSLSFRSLVLLGGLALTPAYGQPGSNPTFNPGDVGNGNGDGFYPYDAYASLIQPDGKIILSGEFQTYNGSGPSYFVRLNPDGSRDGTFLMGSGPDYVNSIAAAPTGDIIIGGVTMYDGVPIPNRVARIHADGTLDPTFQSAAGADRFVSFVAVQPDGKVLVAGGETIAPDTSVLWVGRLNPDGSLDNTFAIANAFDTADVNTIRGMALTSDGKVIVAGFFSAFNGVPQQGLLRLNADGTVDGGFTPDAALSGEIWCMALRSNDKVLLGGRSLLNDAGQNAMVQLNTDGSVDNTFDSGTGFALPSQPGVDPHLYSLLIDLDGKVAVGGRFDVFDGEPHEGLVRLNIDGSNDATFDTGLGCTGSIYTMSLDQDGSIVAAGNFQEYDGYGVGNIARIASDGGLDTGFNPGTGFMSRAMGSYEVGTAVTALAMQADSSFYAAGLFHGYNGVPRNRIARVLADGEVDPTFDPGKGIPEQRPWKLSTDHHHLAVDPG
ncbi:MAG: delta-60 repeat domain-containing protein [Flavobacteriales bacterium]|nr:delta-60 repeat domain-containing protein [Flavobacteriales bacterium]